MRRRRLLAALGASGVAGCTAPTADRTDATTKRADQPTTPPANAAPTVPRDVDLPLPRSALRRAAPKDAIPAITDPAFASDWRDVAIEFADPDTGEVDVYRPRLADDEQVVGVERGGQARAYPLDVLRWHEVVNDDLGGPLLVTYCPLCRSGVTAERRVGGSESRDGDDASRGGSNASREGGDASRGGSNASREGDDASREGDDASREGDERSAAGQVTTFGVSGLLWHENLVMYDAATGSLWSQILARAVRGPATGTALSLVPSTLTRWGQWRETHPDGEVLLPSPLSTTVVGPVRVNYGIDLYARQREVSAALPGDDGLDDPRLSKHALVLGVAHGDAATAYPYVAVRRDGPVNDRVGGRPVVVALAPGDALVAFDRRVGGRPLRFSAADGPFLHAGGSRWKLPSGRAVDGPHAGATLTRASAGSPMFWFAWVGFYPETAVYGREG